MPKEKIAKHYHITYDVDNEENDGTLVDEILDKIRPEPNPQYLFVGEIGKTGKYHHHAIFWSKKCKNTLRNQIQEVVPSQVYFSNPSADKYRKYEVNGVKGVEIYLSKGKTNHMSKEDDIKVRKQYEEQITKMKKYTAEVKKQSEEKKKTEWLGVLKDLEEKIQMTPEQIVEYLADTHYMKEEINFSEARAKWLYWKLLKLKCPWEYKIRVTNCLLNIKNA